MLRVHPRKETKAETQSKKAIRRETANPRMAENVSKIIRPRISDNPYKSFTALSREGLRDLKAHQIDVERQRSTAIFYSRRNVMW